MPIVEMPNGDRVEFPDDMPKEQIKGMIAKKFPEAASSGWDIAGEEWLGGIKGFAKGIGGLALQVPGVGGIPSVGELDPGLKKMVDAPSSTWGESAGRFVGETAPFMMYGPEGLAGEALATRLAPYAGRAAKALGDVMGRGLVGGAAGAAQPTEGGPRERAINAATGAGGAALLAPSAAGRIAGAAGAGAGAYGLELLYHQFGWPGVAAALGGIGGLGRLYAHHGLGGLARRAYAPTRAAGEWIGEHIPAGVPGAAGGRAAEEVQDAQQQ